MACFSSRIGTRTVRRSASPSASAAPQTVHSCIVPRPKRASHILHRDCLRQTLGALYFSAHSNAPTHHLSSIYPPTYSQCPPPQTPSPARTRVASTIAQLAHERHVARLAPAAVAARRSTDHAQDAPGALVPACPGQAATGARLRMGNARKRTARLSDMLTPEAFLAQFTVEKRRDGLGKRGEVGRGSVRRAGFSGQDAGGWTRTRGRSMSLMDGMSLMRLCAAGPSNAWQ